MAVFMISCEEKQTPLERMKCNYIERWVTFHFAFVESGDEAPSNEDICISQEPLSKREAEVLSEILEEEDVSHFIKDDSTLIIQFEGYDKPRSFLMLTNKYSQRKTQRESRE